MRKKEREDLESELIREYGHWEYLKEHGGSDPFYDDAVNLNLTRNHIIYMKKQMEEMYGADYGQYPEIYSRDTPPEIRAGYMAGAAEIRDKAAETLDTYLADDDFRYLLCNKGLLTEKEAKEACIENVLRYVQNLASALKKDDMVTMRRHTSRPETYRESFATCAEKARQMIREKSTMPISGGQQMTLFQMEAGTGQRR